MQEINSRLEYVQMAVASRAAAKPTRAASRLGQAAGIAQFGRPPSQSRPGGGQSGTVVWDSARHCTALRATMLFNTILYHIIIYYIRL